MGVHYLGKRIDGKIGRFGARFTDDEFEALVKRIGGYLPKGWVAWHFNEGETAHTSKRVQQVAKCPLILWESPMYGRTHPSKEKLEEIMIEELRGGGGAPKERVRCEKRTTGE